MSNVIKFPGSKEGSAPIDILELAMSNIDRVISAVVVVTLEDGTTHIRYSDQSNGSLALAALYLQKEATRNLDGE